MLLDWILTRCRPVWTALACLVLAGCVSNAPGANEFTLFRLTLERAQEVTTTVLGIAGAAERIDRARRSEVDTIYSFDPDNAQLFSTHTLPPTSQLYKNSFDALSAYAALMTALASGERARTVAGEQANLLRALSNLARDFPASEGFDSTGDSGLDVVGAKHAEDILEVISTVNATASLVELVAGLDYAAQDRREFTRVLANESVVVLQMLQVLRENSFLLFDYVFWSKPNDPGTPLTDAQQRSLRTFRTVLSNWVVLVDQTTEALEDAIVAAASGRPGMITPAEMSQRIAEIDAILSTIRLQVSQLSIGS